MRTKKDIMVSVLMVTYNHGKYISKTLESVIKQKVDFYYEIVVGEDFSSDNTRTIVKNYAQKHPDKIKLLLQHKNIGMERNFFATFKACTGKYIAFCDGDDYWTDPNKLQKQVDFLESHSDYGLVHCNMDKLYDKTGKLVNNTNQILNFSNIEIFNGLLSFQYSIATLTVLARSELLSKAMRNLTVTDYLMLDLPIWLEMAQLTKFYYFKESVGVYRKVQGSASNDRTTYRAFIESGLRIRLDYATKYSTTIAIKNKLQKDYSKSLLLKAFHSKNQQHSAQYNSYLKKHSLECSPYHKLIYLSINNKILHILINIFDRLRNILISTMKYIIRKNV